MSKKAPHVNLGHQHDQSNLFGGSNARGLYVPMSDVEQEAVSRLIEAKDLVLVIHGWGYLDNPTFLLGDHRIGIRFRMPFDRPAVAMPVYFFDLELKTRAGISLIKERQPCVYGGKPLMIQAGYVLDMQWDIAIHSMDPNLVKMLVPGATGLTSRRQDKDTGEMTAQGNMKLTSAERDALYLLEATQARIRKDHLDKSIEVTEKAGYEVKKTDKGFESQDL